MPESAVRRFRELGITFEKKDIWDKRYAELKQFVEMHQTTRVPKDYVTESGFKLNNSWLSDQRKRYKQGKLSEERAERLRELGIRIEK